MTKPMDHIAKQVASLSEAVYKTAESHQQKLTFIKEELAANTYEINSQHSATKLLEYASFIKNDIEAADPILA